MTDVFQALADPTRRSMLDRLRSEGPLSVGQCAGPLVMTRQAATKHLNVLIEAGLVRARKIGRERRHELVADGLAPASAWLAAHEAAWDRRLGRLADLVEQDPEGDG